MNKCKYSKSMTFAINDPKVQGTVDVCALLLLNKNIVKCNGNEIYKTVLCSANLESEVPDIKQRNDRLLKMYKEVSDDCKTVDQ
jgi:hypothetical protein